MSVSVSPLEEDIYLFIFIGIVTTGSSCCFSYLQCPFWPCISDKCKSKPLELWILMIHKVILQTQQGNILFANCLTDISAIILKYRCSRTHCIIFQLDYILKLYLSQDKYIVSHLHTVILLNCTCLEG